MPLRRSLIFSLRRVLHSAAYLLASLAALAFFLVLLMLIETIIYTISGQAVSIWAMILAALFAAIFFSPVVHRLQGMVDRMFFRKQLDTLEAIQQLGAGDLAELPQEHVEQALLERIAAICHRGSVVLDERGHDAKGRIFCFPESAVLPPPAGAFCLSYELVLPIERRESTVWLHLGSRLDGWVTDSDERQSLKRLARFAAMSLEHARLSHQQSQQVRLDSITRVMGQLHSHDMKNRLHDLAFVAHHLQSGKLDEQDMQMMVTSIRKVVGRIQTLMQRMADPNAPIHPKLKICNLTALLKQRIQERLWPELIHIHIDFSNTALVSGDAVLLQGVFENLFDNALQAMNKQGDLYIYSQCQSGCLQIAVRDGGNGMSNDFIKHRLFRLFATSKADGLGIGLYLSKRIIEAHVGKLSAESGGEGKGSTFWVSLPLCSDNDKDSVS
ncbi:MAG: ATP-binding protein [Mariprofundaceae bacterium]|nr:ATP-binding protein [Mariprofundaceae bacterium]